MKRENRVTLYCWKELRRGVYDSFHVVVHADKASAAKSEYERQGYNVLK